MGSANLESSPIEERTGIIAGRGPLPLKLACSLRAKAQSPFLLLIKDEADPTDYEGFDYEVINIAKVGKMLSALTKHRCQNVVLAGPVDRPNFRNALPDFEGLKLINRFRAAKQLGDDTLLSIVTTYLAEKGFKVIGAHEFDEQLTAGVGPLNRSRPSPDDREDIKKAIRILKTIGALDIGQSLVYREGYVLAVEAAEGTDQMISRCRQFYKDEPAGFLLKMSKPSQNLTVDMPTIGIDTVNSVHEAGLKGIVFEAEKTLLLDQQEIIEEANRKNIFIYAVSSDEL